MFVIIFGPPGAGKGTQAARIIEAHPIPQVATGDIFRKNLREGTALGLEAKGYMEAGKLVPDELVSRIAADRLAQDDCAGGALLDGFPRSLPQAEFLDAWLAEREQAIGLVVHLVVPDRVIVERMGGRRTCTNCGATYHVAVSPTKVEGVCDRCGSAVIQRPDDNEATVLTRLSTYHEQTGPVVEHYRARGVVADIDGVGDIRAIGDAVIAAIEAAF
jgi:adenylate kinase